MDKHSQLHEEVYYGSFATVLPAFPGIWALSEFLFFSQT